MKEFKTIATDGEIEIEIKKSRFICFAKRVNTEEEAREFIAKIKKEHYRANHNCSAFILGENTEIKRSSDDGEPSGTAGIPMLTVLENHDLTNLVVVVTRYFGGMKLGAGGLIRAYSSAVSEAIQAIGTVLIKEQMGISLSLSYAQYQDFINWRTQKELEEYDTLFLEHVTTSIYTDKETAEALISELIDHFHGKINLKEGEVRLVEVPIF